MRYNKRCIGCGSSWCREDNYVCALCYQMLPPNIRRHLFDENPQTLGGSLQIVSDWLRENFDPPLSHDVD